MTKMRKNGTCDIFLSTKKGAESIPILNNNFCTNFSFTENEL